MENTIVIKKVYFGEGHDFVVVGEQVGEFYRCETVSKYPESLLVHTSRLKWANEESVKECVEYLNKIKMEVVA